MVRRRHIRQVQINRRYGALCAGERVRVKLLLRQSMALFISAENQEDEDEANRLRHLGAMVVMVVCRIWRDETELAPTIRGGEPVIDDLADDEAWTNYRFRKPDLKRLFQAFKFPGAYVRLRNRGRYPSESAFLLLLRRMR